jgi:hypothetical protein
MTVAIVGMVISQAGRLSISQRVLQRLFFWSLPLLGVFYIVFNVPGT